MLLLSHHIANKTFNNLLRLLVLPVLLFPLFAHGADDLLERADALLKQKQYEQAYALLEAQSSQRAGDVQFDYLLGIAAMRTNRPSQAMFALERVVQQAPNHAAARMELVGAYLALGLDRDAQRQLAVLETQRPPEAARELMSRYQDLLRPRLSDTPDPVRLIGMSVGYDNNVGSYPDMGIDLGGLLLTIEPVESAYGLLRGTWWQPVRLNDEQRLDFTLHGQWRSYTEEDAEQFNLGLLHGGMMLNTTVDPANKYMLGLQANKLWLDDESFRDHAGVSAYWEHRLDADLYAQLGIKAQTFRFDASRNDYDLYGLSGELKRRFSARLRGRLLLEASNESADAERPGGDAQRYKLGVSADYRIDQRNQIGGELSWTHTEYQEKYAAGSLYNLTPVARDRDDDIFDAVARWRYLLTRDWQFDTDLSYRQQDSSLRFYEIDRWTAQVTVLRYF